MVRSGIYDFSFDMKSPRETFEKAERLCSTKMISGLFETGKAFYSPLFKIVWSFSSETLPFPAKVAFSVSKRGFRLAVTRNLIKRRLREAYRRNKQDLYNALASEGKQIIFVVIIRGNSVPDYNVIVKSMSELIKKLNSEIKGSSTKC